MVLAALCDRKHYLRLGSLIPTQLFPPELRVVREAIDKYWAKDKRSPQLQRMVLPTFVRRLAGNKWTTLEPFLNDVLQVEVTDGVVLHVQDFVQQASLRNLVVHVAESLDRGTVDPERVLSAARSIAVSGYDDERIARHDTYTGGYKLYIETGCISTGLPTLDEALYGGIRPGELAIAIAPYNKGKTAWLVHQGAEAALAGVSVLHISKEIPEWQVMLRYDQHLANMTMVEIMEHEREARKLVVSKLKKTGGSFQVLDYSHKLLSPTQVEELVERHKPGLLILDYADLLSVGSDEGLRFELRRIYEELRRIARATQTPIWTASQATREASKTGIFTGSDVAEDISKMNTCDAAICLQQTEAQSMAQEMRIVLDKTRLPKPGAVRSVRVVCDFDHQSFREREVEIDVTPVESPATPRTRYAVASTPRRPRAHVNGNGSYLG